MSGLDRYQLPTLAEEREDELAEYVTEQAIVKSDEWAWHIAQSAYNAISDVLQQTDKATLLQVVHDLLCDDTSFMHLAEAAVRRDLDEAIREAKAGGDY